MLEHTATNGHEGKEGSEGMAGLEGAKEGRKADAAAREALLNWHCTHTDTEGQQANCEAFANWLGIVRGKPMSVQQADGGQCNLDRNRRNCAAAVLAFEMRLRGFNVTAKPYDNSPGSTSYQLGENTRLAWRTVKGLMPEFTTLLRTGRPDLALALDRATAAVGSRYHLGVNYDELRGHIIAAIRTPSQLLLYDPQRNEFISRHALLEDTNSDSTLEILRVDRLLIVPDIAGCVLRPA